MKRLIELKDMVGKTITEAKESMFEDVIMISFGSEYALISSPYEDELIMDDDIEDYVLVDLGVMIKAESEKINADLYREIEERDKKIRLAEYIKLKKEFHNED